MNVNSAKRLALTLMQEHGLLNEGWSFRFSRGRNQFGRCWAKRNRFNGELIQKGIALSKKLSELNSEEEVRDTILHEIAHAKAGIQEGHGTKWKEVAASIGARPVRCFSTENVVISHKWVGTCADCGRMWKRHRLTLTQKIRGSRHTLCRGEEHNGHVEWKESK